MFRVDINVMAGRSGAGTIFLVEFLASIQEVCCGRACVAFGLMNSREFEEASEAIEVPKQLLEKFREKLWIVKILIPSIGTVSLIEFVGHPGSLGRSHMRRLWAKNSRAVEDAQDAIQITDE